MSDPAPPHKVNYKFESVFGPLEAAIMEAMWALGQAEVREVTDVLPRDNAYTTVKTVMERLTKKGFLTRVRNGKAYRYTPALSQEALEARVAQEASRRLLDGFGSVALTHFVEAAREDPAQLAELRGLLDGLVDEDKNEEEA